MYEINRFGRCMGKGNSERAEVIKNNYTLKWVWLEPIMYFS